LNGSPNTAEGKADRKAAKSNEEEKKWVRKQTILKCGVWTERRYLSPRQRTEKIPVLVEISAKDMKSKNSR
jgi:hypothetical protein